MHPVILHGIANVDSTPVDLHFPGNGKAAEGIVVTAPAGRANQLEFSYFTTKAQGNVVAATNLTEFSQGYAQGDAIALGYKIQNAKISWNYLTYPDPPGVNKFRFRTLWGLQYTTISAHFDAPLDVFAAPVQGSRSLILPAIGIGLEYHFAKNFYVEAKGSGFALPHHSASADGDAKLVVRFHRLDVIAGAKELYFKTSPKKDYYFKANVLGPYAGLRWTFK
jgi:hypothetical protein